MLAESPLNPLAHREKAAEILFETYDLLGLCVANQAVLSLAAADSTHNTGTTGLVLESGDGVTHAVPIYRGRAIKEATLRLELGGSDLTKHLQLLLSREGDLNIDYILSLKERSAFVALDYEAHLREPQLSRQRIQAYGRYFEINVERFQCAEPLFRPSLIGLEERGVHELIYDAIMKCDVNNLFNKAAIGDGDDDTLQSNGIRSKLLGNVVISGGNTMFSGFTNRLDKELKILIENDIHNGSLSGTPDVNLVAPVGNRQYLVWDGGALTSAKLSESQWCLKDEYNEAGASAVHSKAI